MKMQRFWVGRALLLAVAVLYAGGYVRAQEAKDTLTLTLDRALEIALSDNPTIKVAEEEIALKKVTHKETWQNLLPQASIDGTWNHTISAAQMNLGGQSFKMGMDNSNTVSGVLNISLPIFAPSVYKAMSMTKTCAWLKKHFIREKFPSGTESGRTEIKQGKREDICRI